MRTNNEHKNLNVPPLRFPEFSGEWKEVYIKDIASIVGGGTPNTDNPLYWNGDIIWFTPSEIGKTKYVSKSIRSISEEGLKNSSAKILPENTILLSSRATVGECSISTVECSTNQGFQSLIQKKEVDLDFLYYLVQTQRKELLRRACGSTFLEISSKEIQKIRVYVPPLKEQYRIGYLLSLIDKRIETQNKIIEELESLIKGIYEEIFSISDANYIPLRDIAKIQKGQQINSEELSEEGAYYVMNGGIIPSGYLDSYNTPADTISISEGGNSCGYVQYNSMPFWSGGHCYTLINSGSSFNYRYIYYYLKYKEQSIRALRIGSGLPNIQKKDLERFPILNIHKKEQGKMVCIFDELSAKIRTEQRILINYEKQKKYLLSNLFI